ISVIVGAALAIVPTAFAAEVSDGGGAMPGDNVQLVTMAPTSYADALKTYGSTSNTVTPMYEIDPAIRSVLLRDRYTQSVPFEGRPDILGGTGTAPATSSASSTVDWSAVAPAIALGVLLIAMTATVVTRRRHHQLGV